MHHHHHHRLLLLSLIFSSLSFDLASPSDDLPSLPPNNLTLYGDACFRNNTISLTQQRSCLSSSGPGIGRAIHFYPIRFLDPVSNTTASFASRFTFSIVPSLSPGCSFGEGLAFLIASNIDSFSFSDGSIGLPDPNGRDLSSFIAVEFDTSFDAAMGDINDNHIGVDVDSLVSFASVDSVSKGVDLKSGRNITAWIDYDFGEKMFRVWVSYSPVKPQSPALSAEIDLSGCLKEFMHVGFSASNGRGSALHIVERWRFRTFRNYTLEYPEDSAAEGDCFLCSPEEAKFRRRSRNKRDLALGVGGTLAIFVSVLIIVGLTMFFVMRRKGICLMGKNGGEEEQTVRVKVPGRLSLAQIKLATLGFNQSKIVGQGASATVYKGALPCSGLVAIKRFDRANFSGSDRNPFTTEFATMAGCLRHKNLVQLQGWCCEESELVLVYEYLPNGSLHQILHEDPNLVLPWNLRKSAILGVASALSYLHEECERQIIHRDVKTCNIMLDQDFNAKLGDFGLAEVYEHSSIAREATIPVGTMGYLAPEYVYSGVPSIKTDVYSFGVVILEVSSGRRPVDDNGNILVDWVWSLWEKGKLIEAADPKLTRNFIAVEMERMLIVGLCCVHADHEKRPSVKEVARILKGESPVPVLPARKPTLTIRSVNSNEFQKLEEERRCRSPDAPWLTPKSQFSYPKSQFS